MVTATYGACPIKRVRRSKCEMEALRTAIYATLEADHPMTCRQLYYREVSDGRIEKTEKAYQGVVVRLLGQMRLAGDIPFGWIADSTRWQRRPVTWDSMEQALRITAETYARDLWQNQQHYVEVWCEKDALAGVFYEVTEKFHVPLMVSRGYSSLSYLFEAGRAIDAGRKDAFIYFFGDLDPSGLDITRNVEKRLRQFAPRSAIHFERVAVTRDQVEQYNLLTRPTKSSDSRSKAFSGESVEVDALPPAILKTLVANCITQHIDPVALVKLHDIESMERVTFEQFAKAFKGGGR
ncbi:MAG: hypothetical protein M1457_08510 [bacterium]|nr:hypothetical protein [bacterium]